eukprot:4603451-Amphidinium_carterae.1
MDWKVYDNESCLREIDCETKNEKDPPLPSMRLLCEEVSGDVMGLAPLLKLEQLYLNETQVR